jgi:hypothetical protein
MTHSITTTVAENPEVSALPMEESAGATSPFLLEFFMVQGPGFRCMAYCDEDGVWHNALNNEELFGNISILE